MKKLCRVQFEKIEIQGQSLPIGKDIIYIIESFLLGEIYQPDTFYFVTKDFLDHAIVHSIAFQEIINNHNQVERYVYIFVYVIDYTCLKPILYELDVMMYEKTREFKKAINTISKCFCYEESTLIEEGFLFENNYIPERFSHYSWDEFLK